MKKQFVRALHPAQGTTECAAMEVESRFAYPGMSFFYPGKLDSQRLQHALAHVLDDFPQYAGRFVVSEASLRIRHGEGAVSFEHAHSGESVATWVADSRAGRGARLGPGLSKLRIMCTREAALSVRLTEARDGCALAISWNHAVGDMHSTMLLMHAWADAYADRPYEKPKIVTERDAYLRSVMPDPVGARSAARRTNLYRATALRLSCLRPSTHVHIEYSWPELAALRHALSQTRPVSVNDAVCAHVYNVLRRLWGATEPTNLCLVVNFRKRVGLPDQLIGNMTSVLVQPVDEIDPPTQIAAGIRERLDDYATKHANYHATMRVFEANPRASDRARLISRQFTPGSGDLVVSNWTNFGAYDLTFGALRPLFFHPIVVGLTQRLPHWVMLVYELPESHGLAITVGLPHTLAQRCSSPEGQALLHRLPKRTEGLRLQKRTAQETVLES